MDNEKDKELFEDNASNNEIDPDNNTDLPSVDAEEAVEEATEEPSADSEEVQNGKPNRALFKKKFIKLGLAILIILCAVSLLSSAVWAAMANYVFFPKLDDALLNALEPKLDIGTEFDISDLLKQGKAELELSDIEELDIEKFLLSIAYDRNGASFKAALDKNEINAIATKKGIAINSNRLNDGEYYGFPFKDLEEKYKNSAFAYRGESDYAVDKVTHKQILELIETLEEIRDGSADSKKDAQNIEKAIYRAFKKSDISKCEYNYGGIKIADATRSARCKLYHFGKAELLEFVENLIEEFDDPSSSLEKSLESLKLMDGGDNYVVEILENLADQLDASGEKWTVDIAFAYVDDALSAIVGKFTHDRGELKLTLDLGEDPKHDTDIYVTLETREYVRSEGGDKIDQVYKSKVYGSYVVTRENEKGTATLIIGYDRDNRDGSRDKYDLTAKGVFRKREQKADLSLTLNKNGFFDYAVVVECGLQDKASSLSLELDKITFKTDGDDIDAKLPCDIKLSLYKKAGNISLPRYEDVLKMDHRDFDKLYEKGIETFNELAEEYDLSDLDLNIFSDKKPAEDPDDFYGDQEQEENEELNNIGGTIYADAFPETTDMELYGYYEQVTHDRIVEHYNFISSTTFLHDAGQGTKSGKYRIDLDKGRIYFEVQEYPEPYYLVKTFEQIDENTIKIGYDTFRFKYSSK